jgi:pyruvate dehydrogenase E2 component (dihydrolipoamide acetyltransferase)
LRLPPAPSIDFSKFGPVSEVAMSRIRVKAAANLHRSWLTIPRVTQFEEADITEMEAFRSELKEELAKKGVKLTPLPFLMKAVAAALADFPDVNASLHPDGDKLIQKRYYHLGIAVDTDDGLMVPVVRDVDQKGLVELALELSEVSERARSGKLSMRDLQGGSFTISSLGAIGGTGFTPIINPPEAAILGVSRAQQRPVWDGKGFVPRLMLPFSLVYDHRIVDGATAGRFVGALTRILSDVRRLSL